MLLHFVFTDKTLKGAEKDLASATLQRKKKLYLSKSLFLNGFIKEPMILKWHKQKVLSSSAN